MANRGRKPKWTHLGNEKGLATFKISSWKYFHDFIQEKLIDNMNYVFRGQRNEAWKLEPTLNRQLNKLTDADFNIKKIEHLNNFKYSIRGRASFIKEVIDDENELWSIGQHNFLTTPLLDFTYSPYVAAYFAFYEKSIESDYRIIYALSQKHVQKEINDEVELYKPLSGHNPRLINQNSLFVKFNNKESLETISANFFETKEKRKTRIKLYKIMVPNTERIICLKSLNKMNINHNSLFPDLFGASIFCNSKLEIDNY